MHIANVVLRSVTPYSQSKNIDPLEVPLKPKESKDDYDRRTWRHRMHSTSDGFVEIPSTAFVNCLKSSARRLAIQVPGKGKTLFTKYIEAGLDCAGPLVLPLKVDDVTCERQFVPSDGTPGGGRRVYKHFPRIEKWEGSLTFYILDDIITETVFAQVLRNAGILVGIGRFRPENRGFYGRFQVVSLGWVEDGDAALNEMAAQ